MKKFNKLKLLLLCMILVIGMPQSLISKDNSEDVPRVFIDTQHKM